jgi:hypothetical protein
VKLCGQGGHMDFLVLPKNSFFGEYHIILNLKSNIVFKSSNGDQNTLMMCLHHEILDDLIE